MSQSSVTATGGTTKLTRDQFQDSIRPLRQSLAMKNVIMGPDCLEFLGSHATRSVIDTLHHLLTELESTDISPANQLLPMLIPCIVGPRRALGLSWVSRAHLETQFIKLSHQWRHFTPLEKQSWWRALGIQDPADHPAEPEPTFSWTRSALTKMQLSRQGT